MAFTTLKYIITDAGAIIFPDSPLVSHKEIAGNRKVYAAGFVKVKSTCNGVSVQCFGRSDSLDIGSTDKDEIVVKDLFATIPQIKYGFMSVKSLYHGQ